MLTLDCSKQQVPKSMVKHLKMQPDISAPKLPAEVLGKLKVNWLVLVPKHGLQRLF